jgi:long-chain acyl-CoA synthetase
MLIDYLFHHAAAAPDEPAVCDDTGTHTRRQVAALAAGMARHLAAATPRPHVGLLLPPSAAFVGSFYGTLLAGKAVVPINYLLGEREIGHVIADSGIDTVIAIPALAGKLAAAGLKIVDPAAVAPAAPPPPETLPRQAPDDLAVLMYTSGTSGLPKGVMLTYGNLQADTDASIAHARLERRHAFLGIIPLFHAFGMTAMMLCPIQLASPVIYLARFSPVATLEAIRKHRPSILFAVPAMFAALLRLQSATPQDFAGFHVLISGGEALPPSVREAFGQRFGVPLHEGYGLTETSPVVYINVPGHGRAGSVGTAVPGCETRIADEEGRPLPPGQRGEVWLRGPMIMKGYYHLPRETAAVLTPDGFFKTGDLGHLDADGYLYITGRKKDLIICAGEKVAPREVEDVLCRHPAVAEAAVVGRPDTTRGEAVVAFVVLRPGQAVEPEALRAHCRDQGLVSFKIPRDVLVVPELPRTPTGKVLKRELATRAAGLGSATEPA